jgi:SAM-dependent methyltransferase
MSKPDRCPLCGSKALTDIGSVLAADILFLYKRMFGIDVAQDLGRTRVIRFVRCEVCDLRFFTPQTPGGDRLYSRLQKFAWYYLKSKAEYSYAAGLAAEGRSVLDVGCGEGAFSSCIPGLRYRGLELNPRAIEQGRRKGLDIVAQTIAQHAATHSRSYDAVVSFQVLEHVPDARGFLAGCIECVKPGGLMIVSVPSADSFVGRVKNNVLNLPPHHLSWWSDACLGGIASRFSLEMVSIEHHVLEEVHLHWYATELVEAGLAGQSETSGPLVLTERSPLFRLRHWLAGSLAHLLVPGLRPAAMRPRGHSITLACRKPT